MKNKILDFLLRCIFNILAVFTMGRIYTPTNYMWYRKWKGGIWYNYYPRMFPYMSFWIQDKDKLWGHEVITCEEDWTYKTSEEDILDD